ncbi:MAG: hypothetical protein ACYTHJ_15570 [Planctomycetota bacterium]|jgi:hypothetical protein
MFTRRFRTGWIILPALHVLFCSVIVEAGSLFSLRPDSTNMVMVAQDEPSGEDVAEEVTEEASTEEEVAVVEDSSGRHPQWVLDAESAMWDGFLTGLDGYDDFIMPVSMPLYFEDPFITSDLRVLYIYHDIPDRSELDGGQVHAVALQARIALTERLAFIATKDGYSWVDTGITPSGDGWTDWAIGFKYAVISDPENQFLLSSGMRWEWDTGSTDAFQGTGAQELSPFISVAKGWDKLHFLGAVNGRIPTNRDKGNASLVWNLHLDYQLTETFYPLVEFHGIHWLSNGDSLPLSLDYLDVGSLGASDVRGRDFFSFGIGFRWELMENVSLGVTWEYPLESPAENAQQNRVTLNTVISF